MRFKKVMTLSKLKRKIRLFRLTWICGIVGDGKGHSAKLSVNLLPKIIKFEPQVIYNIPSWFLINKDEWRITILGINFHYVRSYGGVFPD